MLVGVLLKEKEMKTPIDAKALREKIEGLYKGVDLTQDDEQLLKNERLSLQHHDPVFREEWEIKNQEAIDLKVQDPVWSANLVARNQAMASDAGRNRAISDSVSNLYKDTEYRARHKEQQQEIAQTQEWKDAHADGMKRREENGWYEKRGKAYKPIHCGEYGDFSSKKEAIERMTKAGVVNAGGKLSVWLDTKNPKNRADEYYYIKEKE